MDERNAAEQAISTADQWMNNEPVAIATVAQARATLFAGTQLQRIADMLAVGFKVSRSGDTFGDDNLYIEPGDPK